MNGVVVEKGTFFFGLAMGVCLLGLMCVRCCFFLFVCLLIKRRGGGHVKKMYIEVSERKKQKLVVFIVWKA